MGITERPGACLQADLLGLQQAGELHSPQDSITSQRCCLCRHRPVPEGALPCCTLSGRAPPGSTGTPPGEKPRQEPRCCLANSLPLQSAERVSPQGSPPAELQVDSHLMPILLPQSALHVGSAAPTQIPQGPRGSGRGGWGEMAFVSCLFFHIKWKQGKTFLGWAPRAVGLDSSSQGCETFASPPLPQASPFPSVKCGAGLQCLMLRVLCCFHGSGCWMGFLLKDRAVSRLQGTGLEKTRGTSHVADPSSHLSSVLGHKMKRLCT